MADDSPDAFPIRRVLLIANPAAGGAARALPRAAAAFAEAGVVCDVAPTERPGHAAELAAAAAAGPERYDAVFTLGGDGTAMEAVGALAGTGVAVGVLPGGTGNLVARTLGTPLGTARAVRALLGGGPALVDLGLVTAGDGAAAAAARHFAFAAGVGIDARMIERTTAVWKRRLGVLAYALAAGGALLAHERFAVRAVVDGEEWSGEASAVMVVNFAAVLGDLFHFGPGIAADDGRLDLCVFAPRTLADATAALLRLARRDFRPHPALYYASGRDFFIETTPALPAQADGEMLGVTPLRVRTLPRAATLLVPRPVAKEPV